MPSLTLNWDAEFSARLAAAYGKKLRLEGPATIQQVREQMIEEAKSVVRGYEYAELVAAIEMPPDVEIT
jgi:hypothetical protein